MDKELKVIVLSGIPGSGKSTWARKFVTGNSKEWAIVNRDSIRDMFGDYWIPNREGLVSDIEMDAAISALCCGFNVILDATNIGSKAQSFVSKIFDRLTDMDDTDFYISAEVKKFDISLNKAIWRDFKRGLLGGRSVGRKVIKKFYNKL